MGEPAGIGGELTVKLAAKAAELTIGPVLALDDPARLKRIAQALNIPITIQTIETPGEAVHVWPKALPVMAEPLSAPSEPGTPSPENAGAVCRSIERAAKLAISGEVAAIVTNPIQKSALYAAGFDHPGHTEFLGKLAGLTEPPVMMLACDALRAVPVTIHQSLRGAVDSLTTDEIVRTALVTAAALIDHFGLSAPKIAIAGLNPHAGEGGAMGVEDIEIITPAVKQLQAAGIDAKGPMPPDTMFSPRARQGYDAAICMYHDQALIPVKALDFDGGVNVTLGLPFIRTSPDHGTALDIAGQGIASDASLIAAARMARQMAESRAR